MIPIFLFHFYICSLNNMIIYYCRLLLNILFNFDIDIFFYYILDDSMDLNYIFLIDYKLKYYLII